VRYQNNTGGLIRQVEVSYEIWSLNNRSGAGSLTFSYSQDNGAYTDVPALAFSSLTRINGAPTWRVEMRRTTITFPTMIPDGGSFYLRFTGAAITRPSRQDEIALDDLAVTALPEPGQVGDQVWFDEDHDGVFDAGEQGIQGASISLSCDADNGADFLASARTDGNGRYLFTGVPAGECSVEVDPGSVPDKRPGLLCPTDVDFVFGSGASYLDADFCFIEKEIDEPCAECKGGVTHLTLQYNGAARARVVIEDDEETYFNAFVSPGESFTLNGTKDDGKFEKNDLDLIVDGDQQATMHVSCSKPIGPGSVFGDFTVVSATSKDNGNVCPVPDCLECKGGATSLTFLYNGASSATIVVEDDEERYFSGVVAPGA
jgi:hypothetical protein